MSVTWQYHDRRKATALSQSQPLRMRDVNWWLIAAILLGVLLWLGGGWLVAHADTQCYSTVTTHNVARIQFCITRNGNVIQLQGPAGWLQVADAEGYGVCPLDGSEGYYDLGGDGAGGDWDEPTITQPKGPNTFPLSISRRTSDGRYTLTQSYKLVGAGKTVGITMTLVGPLARLVRLVDIVPQSPQMADHTSATAFVWTPGRNGLLASPTVSVQVASAIVLGGIQDACRRDGAGGSNAIRLEWVLQQGQRAYVEYSAIR